MHAWGHANQVTFDSTKESFHLLHPRLAEGDCFRMLGVTFGPKLVMRKACYEIAAIAAGRAQIILKAARFYSREALILQYKSQVLSSIDYATPAIYHAPEFFLHAIEKIQNDFLIELDVSASEALLEFNLAPLSSRRDIDMLGLLHRVILNDAPVQFSKYIYRSSNVQAHVRGWAHRVDRHSHQLHDPLLTPSLKIVERPIFKLIHPYNRLPQSIVDCKSTKNFKTRLQKTLKECTISRHPKWEDSLSKGIYTHSVHTFRSWFRA